MATQGKIELNRLRIVLAEKNLTNKWLAGRLKKTEGTISKYTTNKVQPPLETLYEISLLLDEDLRDLIASTKTQKKG